MIDLHVDSFIWTRVMGYNLARAHRPHFSWFGGHADLPRLRDAGFSGAFFAVTTQPFRRAASRDRVWRCNLSRLTREFSAEDSTFVESAAEYRSVRGEGRFALFLAIQGGNCFDATSLSEPLPRELLRVTLIHLTNSRLGGTSAPAGGNAPLTPLGRSWVERLDSERILVDLAHASERTFWDVLRTTPPGVPRIASHTGVSAVRPHWRNLGDAQLRALADSGGCAGIIFHGPYLRGGLRRAEVDDAADHIAHVIDVAGEDLPAIGSDWDGAIRPARGLENPGGIAALVAAMRRRGIPPRQVEKVLAGNALRVLATLRG